MTPLVFLVAVGAAYRLTMLVVYDRITADVRERALTWITGHGEDHHAPDWRCRCRAVYDAHSGLDDHIVDQRSLLDGWRAKVAYLVTCPWCVSFYLGQLVLWSGWCFGTRAWWFVPAAGLAASGAVGTWARYARPAP